jgi:hypothetical protein
VLRTLRGCGHGQDWKWRAACFPCSHLSQLPPLSLEPRSRLFPELETSLPSVVSERRRGSVERPLGVSLWTEDVCNDCPFYRDVLSIAWFLCWPFVSR